MAPELGAGDIVIALAGISIAATFHGIAGFGFSFFAIPILSLIDPEAVPVTILTVMIPMTAAMAFRERSALRVMDLFWLIGGRLPGTAVGVVLLAAVSRDSLAVLFGVMMLLGVVMLSVDTDTQPRAKTQFGAGLVSGVMGTVAAIGGPAQAVVYRNSSGPELRATLSVSFFIGILISLTALGLAGKVHTWQFWLALKLLPAMAVGFLVAYPISRRMEGRALRPFVLGLAAVSSVAAIVSGLVS